MSRRNFILLIIVLIIAVIGFFVFSSLNPGVTPTTDTGGSTGTNFFSKIFNSFGNNKKPSTTPPTTTPTGTTPPTAEETLKLVKVSTVPVAGFTVFSKERLKEVIVPPETNTPDNTPTPVENTTDKKTNTKPVAPLTEFVPALRYAGRVGGIVYQTFVDKIEERALSGNTIPSIYDAYFGNNGESVVMRHLKTDEKTIETFVGALPKEYLGSDTVSTEALKGYFLPENIKDMSLSSNASKIFYLFETGGNVIGTILNFSDNKKTQVFDSPFTEWLSWWPNDKMITLSTKPSFYAPGYMYAVDLTKKNLNRVVGDITGLTTLMSPDGKSVLFGNSDLSLFVYHTDTKNSDSLGIKTLPEKCVWGKVSDFLYCAVPKIVNHGQYPDTWYQGEVSFNDRIWKVDVKTKIETLVLDPITIVKGEEIDGTKLAMDKDENFLFFINKKDSFLWKFDLK